MVPKAEADGDRMMYLIETDPSGNELHRWQVTSCSDMIANRHNQDINFIYKAITGELV